MGLFHKRQLILLKWEQIQCIITHLHCRELMKRPHLYTMYKSFETDKILDFLKIISNKSQFRINEDLMFLYNTSVPMEIFATTYINFPSCSFSYSALAKFSKSKRVLVEVNSGIWKTLCTQIKASNFGISVNTRI